MVDTADEFQTDGDGHPELTVSTESSDSGLDQVTVGFCSSGASHRYVFSVAAEDREVWVKCWEQDGETYRGSATDVPAFVTAALDEYDLTLVAR